MTGYYFDDLQIGQSASLAKTITEADILLYAAVSMDTNPMHVDAEAAKASIFGERIAHGMLSAGLISALLGTRLPGPGNALHAPVAAVRRAGEDRRHGEGDGDGRLAQSGEEAGDAQHRLHRRRRGSDRRRGLRAGPSRG